MRAILEKPTVVRLLVLSQVLIVTVYAYAVVAYVSTDAAFFPEQSPPPWSWPAVVIVGVGFVPAALCVLLAAGALRSPRVRAESRLWTALILTSAATVLTLVLMISPFGWALFDWYVS